MQRNAIQSRLEMILESVTESLWEADFRSGQLSLRGRFAKRFGLSDEQIERAMGERSRAQGRATLSALLSGGVTADAVGE